MSIYGTDLVRGLPEGEASRVLALADPISVPSGGVLFQLGEDAENVYVVVSGRVDLTLPMRIRDREEDVLLEEKRPGEILGWSGLIAPHRFTLKATAPVDSELLAFPRRRPLATDEVVVTGLEADFRARLTGNGV